VYEIWLGKTNKLLNLNGEKLMKAKFLVFVFLSLILILVACSPSAISLFAVPVLAPGPVYPTSTFAPLPTATATRIPVPPAETATPLPTDGPALKPVVTNTQTVREMLQTHIVFYLIQPVEGRQDACGNIKVVPIISKRLRTGDKIYDVQVALQMLFALKRKTYLNWYNALWDTSLAINKYQYNPNKDYMIVDFTGYLDAGHLSNCDKHGIREQVWKTFFHYGIREKTFTIDGHFLIDQLNRKTK
jgi:hypothetical protein